MTGRKAADYLTTGQVFTGYAAAPASGGLGQLSVQLPVDVNPSDAKQRYVLKDDIVASKHTAARNPTAGGAQAAGADRR